jgi:hypothetical protein
MATRPVRPVPAHPKSAPELIVVAKPEALVRSAGTSVAAAPGARAGSLNSLLKSRKIALRPLFDVSEDRAKARMGAALAGAAAVVPDVSTFYVVDGAPRDLARLAAELRNETAIDAAYVKPAGEPPEWFDRKRGLPKAAPRDLSPAPTADFSARQAYLDAAPGGVDARFAWTKPGGHGGNVRVVDLEWGWNFSHEDLLQNQGGIVAGAGAADTDHGTCVIGEISGDRNNVGVMGIASDATLSAVAFSMPSATAIRLAADRLQSGDVMLLEIHRPGPRFDFQSRSDQRGYIAVEWWPDDFAAILYASARGILVIEAAGNGAEDLDAAIYATRPPGFPGGWTNPFNRANPQCGAIICGAGAPPPGTHGRSHGADRSRLDFSNFGACVDVQGWGREVTTTGRSWGVADLFDGGVNAWYTDQFSGTSSASPIVTGVLACVQGMLRAAGKPGLSAASARNLLRSTGSPQQDEPGRPATERIGHRPDLRAIHAALFPKTAVKDTKDLKETQKEQKEKSEIKEKAEIKERKDVKEGKEKAETKERKDLGKEFKEKPEIKEHKEQKEFEKVSDNVGGELGAGGPGSSAGALEERVRAIERRLGELAHFIEPALRPDLAASALTGEQDLDYLQGGAGTAAGPKADKDAKDAEKLRDR